MTPDLQQEFRSLSEKAKQQLKAVPESGSYRRLFSFWAFPSFSPALRCTLYSPLPRAHGKQPFASFTLWRSDLDLEKMSSPIERLKYPKDLDPTLEEDVVWLTEADICDIEQRLRGISIPLYLGQPGVFGCDGTSFEFSYDHLFVGVG